MNLNDPKIVRKAFKNFAQLHGLSIEEQAVLLAVNAEVLNNEALFEDHSRRLIAASLVDIHTALRTLFPHNKDLAHKWMKTPNEEFAGKSPLNFVLNDDFFTVFVKLQEVNFHLLCEIKRGA